MRNSLIILCVFPLFLIGGCRTTMDQLNQIGNPHTGPKYAIEAREKIKGRQVYGKELFDLLAGTTFYVKAVDVRATAVVTYSKSGSFHLQASRRFKSGGIGRCLLPA